MNADPELLEMLELLQQYMNQQGFVICEIRSDLGGTLEQTDAGLADFYTDWINADI